MRVVFFIICIALLSPDTLEAQSAIEIVKKAIALKAKNDPRQLLEIYSYDVYEKTIITDSFTGEAHNYFSEKASSLYYSSKRGYKETVLGFQQAGFETLHPEVLNITLQSQSFYDPEIIVFNRSFAGILSASGLRYYEYTLLSQDEEEIEISFTPATNFTDRGVSGSFTLDAKSLALKDISFKTAERIGIQLGQDYEYIPQAQCYLPKNTLLIIDSGKNNEQLSFFGGRISIGNLQRTELEDNLETKHLISETIRSNFSLKAKDTFTQKYDVVITPSANTQPESFWQQYRKEPLNEKDVKSFSAIRSIVKAEDIERRLGTINNFSIGYYSLNFFNLDLTYPIKFNNYEGLRLGLGGVTNTSFSERFRLEGYVAYGFKDQEFKYGGGGGYLLDPDHGAWLSITHNKDLEEVGSYAYLTDRRVYSLFEPRLVNINQFYKHRTTRLNLEYQLALKVLGELQLAHRRLDQTIPYAYDDNERILRNYNISEATVALRWSPESSFMKSPMGTLEIVKGHPIITFQASQSVDGLEGDFTFTKLGVKAFYSNTFLNDATTEILVEGKIGFGDIPITHLFHAFPNAPTKETILQRFSVAGVNSFETMYFGEFFSDQLFTAQLKHRLRPFNLGKKFKPEMVFITRFAIGDIRHPERHLDINFESLKHGYTESGFEINKLFFGFGTSLTYRYGAYYLPNFEDNISFKFTFNLKL